MDRSAVITFSGQLPALRDSEAFDGIIHVVERLGSFLCQRIVPVNFVGDIVEDPEIRQHQQFVPDLSGNSLCGAGGHLGYGRSAQR